MLIIPDHQIESNLGYPELINALKNIFTSSYTMPLRHHHFYTTPEGHTNTLILMPSWTEKYIGMKQVTVAPANADINLPSIFAQYILSDAITGQPLALMNAAGLTSRRTACTSALAASYLARKDSKNLLIIGGGKVAEHLAEAHLAVRNYEKVSIWMRNKDKMSSFISKLKAKNILIEPVENLENAIREADVISAATLSQTPIIKGEWLKEGVHLDLIGSHKPDTREADDQVILKSQIFVDSRLGALHETGELHIPIQKGIISENDVLADITELIQEKHPGRKNEKEITLFKSAGLAIEDLAAALLVYESHKKSPA